MYDKTMSFEGKSSFAGIIVVADNPAGSLESNVDIADFLSPCGA